MRKVLLIDANAMGFAGHTGAPIMKSGESEVQAIYVFMKTLHRFQTDAPKDKRLVIWDGKASWRKEIYPDYKGNRDKNPKMSAMRASYREQVPTMQKITTLLGIDQYQPQDFEADDIAAMYSRALSNKGHQVVLITSDKDWLQLVNDKVHWFDPVHGDKYISLANFYEQTGFETPIKFMYAKIMQGDTSDNIRPVGGVGEGRAKEILAEFDTPQDAIAFFREQTLLKKWQAGMLAPEWSDKFDLNTKLVNLQSIAAPKGSVKGSTIRGAYDEAAVREWFDLLYFRSLTFNFDKWIQPFRSAHEYNRRP